MQNRGVEKKEEMQDIEQLDLSKQLYCNEEADYREFQGEFKASFKSVDFSMLYNSWLPPAGLMTSENNKPIADIFSTSSSTISSAIDNSSKSVEQSNAKYKILTEDGTNFTTYCLFNSETLSKVPAGLEVEVENGKSYVTLPGETERRQVTTVSVFIRKKKRQNKSILEADPSDILQKTRKNRYKISSSSDSFMYDEEDVDVSKQEISETTISSKSDNASDLSKYKTGRKTGNSNNNNKYCHSKINKLQMVPAGLDLYKIGNSLFVFLEGNTEKTQVRTLENFKRDQRIYKNKLASSENNQENSNERKQGESVLSQEDVEALELPELAFYKIIDKTGVIRKTGNSTNYDTYCLSNTDCLDIVEPNLDIYKINNKLFVVRPEETKKVQVRILDKFKREQSKKNKFDEISKVSSKRVHSDSDDHYHQGNDITKAKKPKAVIKLEKNNSQTSSYTKHASSRVSGNPSSFFSKASSSSTTEVASQLRPRKSKRK